MFQTLGFELFKILICVEKLNVAAFDKFLISL